MSSKAYREAYSSMTEKQKDIMHDLWMKTENHDGHAWNMYCDIEDAVAGIVKEQIASAKPDVPDTNVGDMISRQAAMDEVESIVDTMSVCISMDECKGMRRMKDNVLERLKALPSAQPEPIRLRLDHELSKEEYERLKKACAEQPVILLPKESAQPAQRNARVFQGIVVEYPSISAYPEYEGKPYFSIKYTVNGQKFIGYGTYKPEVLSEYLKEYFMPPTQPEWISCTPKTMPKMTDIYLVKVRINQYGEGMYPTFRTALWHTASRKWFVHESENSIIGEVTEWMPIPWEGNRNE